MQRYGELAGPPDTGPWQHHVGADSRTFVTIDDFHHHHCLDLRLAVQYRSATMALAELIGESPPILAVRDQLGRLLGRQSNGRRPPPLLVLGETGTGKGLLARAAHRGVSRRQGPFLSVNCAAIPEGLVEAELFGFERGAFTDARASKVGLIQAADGGTLFLDEVGLLPGPLQAKLLTVVEDQTVRRVGSTLGQPVDVWIVTATSVDLAGAVRTGHFREDLYHRLAVVSIKLPPLRERDNDIILLAEWFLGKASADYGLPSKVLSAGARAALLAYAWPGNIRELANVMERVMLLLDGPDVRAESLGLPSCRRRGRSSARVRCTIHILAPVSRKPFARSVMTWMHSNATSSSTRWRRATGTCLGAATRLGGRETRCGTVSPGTAWSQRTRRPYLAAGRHARRDRSRRPRYRTARPWTRRRRSTDRRLYIELHAGKPGRWYSSGLCSARRQPRKHPGRSWPRY